MKIKTLERMASEFLALAQTTSGAPGEFLKVLQDAGLFGGQGEPDQGNFQFDINSPTADIVFGLLEKMNYKGSVAASLTVGTDLSVTIQVEAADPKAKAALQQALTQKFSARMSAALKAKAHPPAQVMTLPWFHDVRLG